MKPRRSTKTSSRAFLALMGCGLMIVSVVFYSTDGGDLLASLPEDVPKSESKSLAHLKYQPWNCDEVLNQVRHTSKLSWSDPNKHELHARHVTAVPNSPPFSMALSVRSYDHMRWEIMEKGVYYEKVLTKVFVDILRDDAVKRLQQNGKDVRVLDVGSNQGWFSLVSANMGYPVDAFDANPINLLRICESNQLNGWRGDGYHSLATESNSIVNVYNFGVSDEADIIVPFAVPQHNPGAASFQNGLGVHIIQDETYTYSNMTLLTLDAFARERDWLTSEDVVVAILKVDVEGLEDKVFRGARELIRSGRVRNVLMEVTATSRLSIAQGRSVVRYLANEAGLGLRAFGYWLGPNQDGGSVTGSDALAIIEKNCFEQAKTCNLWWQPKE